jgi:hypothetical protein
MTLIASLIQYPQRLCNEIFPNRIFSETSRKQFGSEKVRYKVIAGAIYTLLVLSMCLFMSFNLFLDLQLS